MELTSRAISINKPNNKCQIVDFNRKEELIGRSDEDIEKLAAEQNKAN